ncbi:TonB-dependent receptor domain-containing protein [candidate division KSB1 bacterium]
MKKLTLVSILLVCIFSSVPVFAQTATLKGTVTDIDTGEKLAKANIIVYAQGTTNIVTGGASDQNGDYEITRIAPGNYTVTVSYIGYEQRTADITLSANETKIIPFDLIPGAIQAEQIVVSASRRSEKAIEAPASVTVVESAQIEARETLTPVEHLIGVAAVDISKTGISQANMVIRGFNNVFSGALLSIVDNRISRVPSLRLNAYNFIPTSNLDIDRIEVVRGPGSALYGPNSANGVFHMITKSPFGSEGTTVSVSGGERGLVNSAVRHAGSYNNKFGYKFTINHSMGEDFKYLDGFELEERALAIADPNREPGKIALRDFDFERFQSTAQLNFRIDDETEFIVNGGFNTTKSIELTGLGAGQADNWSYSYVQSRFMHKKLFMQAFVNMSDAGDTYLLRDGAPIVDKSKFYVYQIQHSYNMGENQLFTYGVDAIWTRPVTEGTVNGRNEDNDDINEYGVYVQSETDLNEKLKFVAAGRYDTHNHMNDPVFSPRAALVFKPNATSNLRVSFNRAFSTPSALNLFLDLNSSPASLSQPFSVRVRGVPKDGFSFRRDTNGGLGGLYMQPLWIPSTAFMPADATLMWSAIVGVLAAQGTDISAFPAPTAAQVSTMLRVLNTTTKGFDAVTHDYVKDINPIESTKTNTIEVGYNGVLNKKWHIGLDVYHSKINDFIGPLRVETPSVFLDPATLGAYLSNPAFGLPPATVAALTAAIAGIPVGTVTPNDALDPSDLMLTYKNFGDISLNGLDLSLSFYATPKITVTGTYSYVSKDFFKEEPSDIALNAPKNKAGLILSYNDKNLGFNAGMRFRYVDGFPVNSGVFVGDTDDFTTVDFTIGKDLPFANSPTLSLVIQNAFNNEHNEFIGAPKIGRLSFLKLTYAF